MVSNNVSTPARALIIQQTKEKPEKHPIKYSLAATGQPSGTAAPTSLPSRPVEPRNSSVNNNPPRPLVRRRRPHPPHVPRHLNRDTPPFRRRTGESSAAKAEPSLPQPEYSPRTQNARAVRRLPVCNSARDRQMWRRRRPELARVEASPELRVARRGPHLGPWQRALEADDVTRR